MTFRRTWGLALTAALAGALLLPACSRRKTVEVNPIVPSVKVNRVKAPLGSALEITYTWTLEPGRPQARAGLPGPRPLRGQPRRDALRGRPHPGPAAVELAAG